MTSADNNPNADFSDVGGAASTKNSPATGRPAEPGSTRPADFSDVSAGSSSTVGGTGTYIVKKGDSLSKIAKQFYGDAGKWKAIHLANSDKIPNPDLIHPGLELTIPDA
jgi:nucleoid-associated protein YgaU